MLKIFKKYKAPYLFILPFFLLFLAADSHYMDILHQPYKLEGDWSTGVLRDQ